MLKISQRDYFESKNFMDMDEKPDTCVYYSSENAPSDDFYEPASGFYALVFLPGTYQIGAPPWIQEYYDDFEEKTFKTPKDLRDWVKSEYPSVTKFLEYPHEDMMWAEMEA